ncbi:hypothetical protein K493DRAFT_320546 [Basidiobolus meristosporus CBS 931.73]|uniref:Polysaccharide lyase 14 domain-containing protein n=1 Tax=Basidiobolus meristosporus CBS 931.73 TaxID=1314790 RepID=A0A1Y1X866_9FUNG|nr:hypothetical protein K493DRAFT_320546 [Basidiobolus meristosporus CBS 931.73]|eukprot:ORX81949.1 hypothetical protein K493DRAFT_320546 [Basidiobolus meristosporus CBS 931.73]
MNAIHLSVKPAGGWSTLVASLLLLGNILCVAGFNTSHTVYESRLARRASSSWSSGDSASLNAWGIEKIAFGKDNYQFVKDPAGGSDMVLRVFYPQGSRTPTSPGKQGGVGFYADPIQLQDEATLEYQVYFPENFNFVKGGKLPGFYGGSGDCTQDSRNGNRCFSTRFMWRDGGDGEVYSYAPDKQASEYCHIPPETVCNPQYGDSLARGSFKFTPGKWSVVRQSIRLNTVGKQDGLLKVWMDGQLVIDYNQMVFRVQPDAKLSGILFHTFFGGADPSYRTPVNTYTYFKEVTLSPSAA